MNRPRRKPARLPGWDYATPANYFVTLVTLGRREVFGSVLDSQVILGELGQLAAQDWLRIGRDDPSIALDAFVVMPNHLHGILGITQEAGPGVSEIMRIFKARVTLGAQQLGFEGTIWQHGFHDRILRDRAAVEAARRYIEANPARWSSDPEAPRAR